MKKVLIIAISLLTTTVAMAQWGPRRPAKQPAENYELKASNGRASMVIDAANGARIMSLRWDSTEVISQNPAPNMYGSTFWTSPQKEWNWPPVHEHDMGKYLVAEQDGQIIMTSQLSEKIPLRIKKTFSAKGKDFVITYTITNEGETERSVAPWEVTRVPGEGTISFYAPVDKIWPAGLMDFKNVKGMATFNIDKVAKQRKINANGTSKTKGLSYLRYENNGLVLEKTFPDLKDGEAAPGEDEIQVYVHDNALYCELEEQGAYKLLKPGESLEWTVTWRLSQGKK